jgi:hypothetical protein
LHAKIKEARDVNSKIKEDPFYLGQRFPLLPLSIFAGYKSRKEKINFEMKRTTFLLLFLTQFIRDEN